MKTGKRLLAVVLMVLMVVTSVPVTLGASPLSGTSGYLTWTLDDKGTLTISGKGRMASYSSSTSASARKDFQVYADQIKNVVIEDGANYIGDHAFQRFSNLKSVKIPGTVTTIGWYAFASCTALTDVTIANGVSTVDIHAFEGCTSLKSISFPASVKRLSNYAFAKCTSLEKVYIYNSLCSIFSTSIPKTTTIYGLPGSTAQTFAEKNGQTFVAIDGQTPGQDTDKPGGDETPSTPTSPNANEPVYNAEKLPTKVPQYPTKGHKYWVIFNEGFRNNRLEMSTFDVSNNAKEVKIIWSGNLKASSDGEISRTNQFHYTEEEWVYDRDYGVLSDKATKVFASNVNVYDSDGKLLINASNELQPYGFPSSNPQTASVPSDAASFNGHYYKVYEEQKSWTEAKNYCESLDGHLVVITTSEEQVFVTNYAKTSKATHFWIGASMENGKWKWVTKEDFSFANWAPGEPNGNGSYCEMYNLVDKAWGKDYGLWDDWGQKTDVNPGFICEWDSTEPAVAPSVSAPTGLKVAIYNTTALKLTWNKVDGATGYVVYQYNPSTKKYKKLDATKANVYIVKNLNPETTYKFKVKAYKKVDGNYYYSDASKALKATTAVLSEPKIYSLSCYSGKNGNGNKDHVGSVYNAAAINSRLLENHLDGYTVDKNNIHAYGYDTVDFPTTRDELQQMMEYAFQGSSDMDLCFFYFAGHASTVGPTLESKKGSSVAQLEYNWSELAEDLSKYTEGNVFVLMDTCYSGRLIDVVKERSDANRFTVITATTADLEAAAGPLLPFYYKNQYYHYLSYYCAEGIGYFDGKVRAENGKGIVTAGSLLDYVKPRVAQKTKEDEKKGAIQQTVQFFGNRNLELFQFTSYTNIPRPYSLQVAARTTDALKLKWGKVSDATGYILYQYNASTKEYTKLAITQSNAYTVKDLQPGTTYRFAVRAYRIKYDKTYYSVYSKALVTATKPVAPTVTVKANNGKPIVSWNKVNGATGYEVYYSTKKNGTYQFLISTTKNKVQAIDSIPKGTYYVKVRAYKKISNEVIYSNYSTAKKAIVK